MKSADSRSSEGVSGQYRDATNLGARQQLYQDFGTAVLPWQAWVFPNLRLPAQARVLEVGCGPGRLWTENRSKLPRGWHVTLTDLSPGMLAEAELQLQAAPEFEFLRADLNHLGFLKGSFDAVIANHMLYHMPNLSVALAEVHRVLAPGGILIAATNGPDHLRQLRQLQAAIGTLPSPRSHVEAAFNLVSGPPQMEGYFRRVTVKRHPEELRVTDSKAWSPT